MIKTREKEIKKRKSKIKQIRRTSKHDGTWEGSRENEPEPWKKFLVGIWERGGAETTDL